MVLFDVENVGGGRMVLFGGTPVASTPTAVPSPTTEFDEGTGTAGTTIPFSGLGLGKGDSAAARARNLYQVKCQVKTCKHTMMRQPTKFLFLI